MSDLSQTKEKLFGKAKTMPVWKRAACAAGVAVVCLALWWTFSGAPEKVSYMTKPVQTGDLIVTVSADGTLKPVRTVSVGSELSGIVSRVNVDVNSVVKVGDVLIELDCAKLESAVNQARATLTSAEAKLLEAQAVYAEAKAKLARYEELNRTSAGKMPSRAQLDEQRATVKKARAGIAVAQASIDDAKATLQTNETNLSKAFIRSPVDGVVLTRSVEPGYAVAASLQAVELLTVATDLHELELQVDVDEADVGEVRPGLKTTFTVSAYPDRPFPATLTKVAYGASSGTDKVVTYTTYLAVKNPELKLRSGMTATAIIETARKNDVLLVPNTALRFRPEVKTQSDSATRLMMPGPRHAGQKTVKETTRAVSGQSRTVYVLNQKGNAVKRDVKTGMTDGTMTEILSGDLKAGDKVIISQLKKNN